MVDKIVEFINRKGITLDDLKTGVTIASAGNGEQVVIKDLVVSGAQRSIALRIGNATISNVSCPARLTGSELIGEGTALVAKTQFFPMLNKVTAYAQSTVSQAITKTLFTGDSSFAQGAFRTNSSFNSTGYAPLFACVGQNKDFYWSNLGRSDTSYNAMYRRAGGVSGTETVLFGNCFEAAYDGERYIWAYSTANQGIVIDTATGAQSTLKYVTPAGAATPVTLSGGVSQSALIDGYVLLVADSSGQVCLIELATGVVKWLDIGSVVPSQGNFRSNIGINKTTSGEYVFVRGAYVVSVVSGSWIYTLDFVNLGTSLATPSILSGSRLELTDPNIVNNAGQNTANRIQRAPGVPNLLFYTNYSAPTQLVVIDLTTLMITQIPMQGLDGFVFAITCDQTIAAKDFGTIDIRATGIRSS